MAVTKLAMLYLQLPLLVEFPSKIFLMYGRTFSRFLEFPCPYWSPHSAKVLMLILTPVVTHFFSSILPPFEFSKTYSNIQLQKIWEHTYVREQEGCRRREEREARRTSDINKQDAVRCSGQYTMKQRCKHELNRCERGRAHAQKGGFMVFVPRFAVFSLSCSFSCKYWLLFAYFLVIAKSLLL